MKSRGKKLIASLGVITILGASILTGSLAAGTEVKGKISTKTIYNNGVAMTLPFDQKPIMVNNRIYLPVRALGELLGKVVGWSASDPESVYINEDPNTQNILQEVIKARAEIIERDVKITVLENKIKELEGKVDENKVTSISDFQKKLKADFKVYKDVYLDIGLTGNKDNVKLVVYIEPGEKKYWEGIKVADREGLVKDLIYAIQKEYTNASVDGYINGGNTSEYFEFYTDNRNRIQFKGSGVSGSKTISELKTELYNRHYDDVRKIDIYEKTGYIEVKVELVDYWMSTSNKDILSNKIKDYIYDYFRYETVYVDFN